MKTLTEKFCFARPVLTQRKEGNQESASSV